MKENVSTIKFTGFMTILFALLTYIVAINMGIGLFEVDRFQEFLKKEDYC